MLNLRLSVKTKAGVEVTQLTHQLTGAEIRAHKAVIALPIKGMHLWSPDDPFLYDFTATVSANDICDEKSGHFGMREFTIKDGGFRLNSQPFTILGSNALSEWLWGRWGEIENKQKWLRWWPATPRNNKWGRTGINRLRNSVRPQFS